MQRILEVGGCHVTLLDIVAVAFVDDDAVADFHDAALDALQVVARSCQLDEQEEIDHGVTRRLALSYAYRLDEYLVETGSLAEDDGLTGLAGHAA